MKLKNKNLKLFSMAAAYSAVGGFVLRYLMREQELLPNGSIAEGAVIYRVLPLVCLLFALGTIVLFWKIPRHTEWSSVSSNSIPSLLLLGAACVLAIGNVLLCFGEEAPASIYVASAPEFAEFLGDLVPPLGILAAGCMGYFAYCGYQKKKPSALLYMCVSLYFAVRLIVRFQVWNTDPSIHDYCYALLANIFAMLATFHVAGFSFDKGKRRMSIFCLMCSIIFGAITLADAIFDGDMGDVLLHVSILIAGFAHGMQLLGEEKGKIEE